MSVGLLVDGAKLPWSRGPIVSLFGDRGGSGQDFESYPLEISNYSIDRRLELYLKVRTNFSLYFWTGKRGVFGFAFRPIVDMYLMQDGTILRYIRLSDRSGAEYFFENNVDYFGNVYAYVPPGTQSNFKILVLSRPVGEYPRTDSVFFFSVNFSLFSATFSKFV